MSNFDRLKSQLETAQALNATERAANARLGTNIDKIPDSVDKVRMRDIAGLSKMGFSSLADGQKFGAERDRLANLKPLFVKLGEAAVPVKDGKLIVDGNGQPVPSRNKGYDEFMSALGSKFRQDPKVLEKLSRDIAEHPGMDKRLLAAIEKDPSAAAKSIATYTGANGVGPDGKTNGQLENLVNGILGPEAKAEVPPPPKPPAPAARAAAPAAVTPPPQRAAAAEAPPPVDKVAPMAAVAAAAAPDEALAQGETTMDDLDPSKAKLRITSEDIAANGGLADELYGTFKTNFPDMVGLEEFRDKLKNDRGLQERVAQNLNNNPDFVTQLTNLATDNQDKGPSKLLQQFGRSTVQDLVDNPEKLASDAYVDNLSGQLKMADGSILDKIGSFFRNFDFQGMLGKIGSFLKPIMNMIGNFVGKLFGGSGNLMSMGNGPGLLQNVLGQANGYDAAVKEALRDRNLRVVDRNNDGIISDGYTYTADGKRVQEQYVDDKGKTRTRDAPRNDALDDRITVTDASGKQHRVYQSTGINDGYNEQGQTLRFQVTKIDPKTGRPTGGEIMTVQGETVVRQDAETGRTIETAAKTAADAAVTQSGPNVPNVPKVPGTEPGGMAGPGAPTANPLGV